MNEYVWWFLAWLLFALVCALGEFVLYKKFSSFMKEVFRDYQARATNGVTNEEVSKS